MIARNPYVDQVIVEEIRTLTKSIVARKNLVEDLEVEIMKHKEELAEYQNKRAALLSHMPDDHPIYREVQNAK